MPRTVVALVEARVVELLRGCDHYIGILEIGDAEMFRTDRGFLRQFQWTEIVVDGRSIIGPHACQDLLRIADIGVGSVGIVLIELGHCVRPGGPSDGGDEALH